MAAQKSLKNAQMLALLRTILRYAAPKGDRKIRIRILLAVLCLVLAKTANLVTPLFYGQAVDLVNTEGGFDVMILWYILGGYASARLSQQIFMEGKEYLFSRVSQRAVRGAAMTAFEHLHRLSLKFHLDRQTGGLSRAIERGAKGMEFILTRATFDVFPLMIEVVLVSSFLWFMFGIEYALITFCTVMLYGWFTVQVTEWRMAFRRQMNEADEQAATKAVDSLLNFETVKYFNAEGSEARRYDSSLRRYEDAAVLSRTSLAAVNIGQGMIIAVGLVLMMGMAGLDIQRGELSVGDFVAVNTYLIQLYLPLNFLGFVYREIRQAFVDLERMFGLLDVHPDVDDRPGAPALHSTAGEIRFENVHFAYHDRPILKGVSFVVPAGKKVVIVGPSGAGKSTLSRLLFRFYDPQSGHIEIDGQNIREVQQASVRSMLGVVPQDTVMFNASIGYNIGYGREDATQQDIQEAARLARIDSFIENLPQGFDTLVGERGLKLSGGEKQRVAIARAILKRPSVFLFDEATSALDSRTEKEIQSSLNEVSREQTTLVIAHRLSTIVDADEIIVLVDGRIAEQGTHAELIAQKAVYAGMWERQSKGFVSRSGKTALEQAQASTTSEQ